MAPITSDHDRQLLAHLGEQPGWEALRQLAKDRMDKEFVRLAKEMMRGADVPAETIAYRRGFFAGMKHLLDNPTLEARKLQESLAEERSD